MEIYNYSLNDIKRGEHEVPENAVLIQIYESHSVCPKAPRADEFSQVFQFELSDKEFEFTAPEITQAQALKATLRLLARNSIPIVVHCAAGLSRSGAVVEAALELGYTDPEFEREPNKLLLDILNS